MAIIAHFFQISSIDEAVAPLLYWITGVVFHDDFMRLRLANMALIRHLDLNPIKAFAGKVSLKNQMKTRAWNNGFCFHLTMQRAVRIFQIISLIFAESFDCHTPVSDIYSGTHVTTCRDKLKLE